MHGLTNTKSLLQLYRKIFINLGTLFIVGKRYLELKLWLSINYNQYFAKEDMQLLCCTRNIETLWMALLIPTQSAYTFHSLCYLIIPEIIQRSDVSDVAEPRRLYLAGPSM